MNVRKPIACYVESEEEYRDALRVQLSGKGFRVISFSDGEKLLKYLAAENGIKTKPSLILLDIAAHGLGGFDAARRLTQRSESADIPIIMMAKHCCIEDKIEAQAAGAITCLQKPVSMAAIEEEINNKNRKQRSNPSQSLLKQY